MSDATATSQADATATQLPPPTWDDAACLSFLANLPQGSFVSVKFFHVRNADMIRTIDGAVRKGRVQGRYNVVPASGSQFKFPDPERKILEIKSIAAPPPSSRSSVASGEVLPTQPRPAQPTAEIQFFTQMINDNRLFLQAFMDREERLRVASGTEQNRIRLQEEATNTSGIRRQSIDDVGRVLLLTDAAQGRAVTNWIAAPGLLLPRNLPAKFEIFSMLSLLWKEDPVTGEMVRVPRGTAVASYLSKLSANRFKFPSQIAVAGDDSNAGVRSQLDRAEAVFLAELTRLDSLPTSELPTSKEGWMPSIHMGLTILEHFATLAYGFKRGGEKISINSTTALNQTGRFDPAKLWTELVSSSSSRPFRTK
jgi:hypothetical protein